MFCLVCGDTASGVHYGVLSCEGCKGFFRRALQEKRSQLRKCIRAERCKITMKTRNHCQPCRLRRCLELGMSREAARLGRRSRKMWKHLDLSIAKFGGRRESSDGSSPQAIVMTKCTETSPTCDPSTPLMLTPSPVARRYATSVQDVSGIGSVGISGMESNFSDTSERTWDMTAVLPPNQVNPHQARLLLSDQGSPTSSERFPLGSIPSVDTSISGGEWNNAFISSPEEDILQSRSVQVLEYPQNQLVLFWNPENECLTPAPVGDADLTLPLMTPTQQKFSFDDVFDSIPVKQQTQLLQKHEHEDHTEEKIPQLQTIVQQQATIQTTVLNSESLVEKTKRLILHSLQAKQCNSPEYAHDPLGAERTNRNGEISGTVKEFQLPDGLDNSMPLLILTQPTGTTEMQIGSIDSQTMNFKKNQNASDLSTDALFPKSRMRVSGGLIFSDLLRTIDTAFSTTFKQQLASVNYRRSKEDIKTDNEATMKRLFCVSQWEEGKYYVASAQAVQSGCLRVFQTQFNEIMQDVVRFAKRIPGFSYLPPDDRMILVESGCFKVACILFSFCINEETKTFHGPNEFVLSQNQLWLTFPMGRKLTDQLFEFCLRLRQLKLEPFAMGLLSTVIILTPDRLGLHSPEVVGWLRDIILQVFRFQIVISQINGSETFDQILSLITDLENLASEHRCQLIRLKAKGFQFLNDLYSETFGLS